MDYGYNRTRTGASGNAMSPSRTLGNAGVNISVGLTFSPAQANQTEEHVIIHRSDNCIVLNNFKEEMKRKIQREHDIKTKGWFSKEQMPYQQLGKFSNIYDGVEKVKENLPHTRKNYDDITVKNLKFIKKVQNHHNIHLQEPGRTVKTLRQYHGQIIDTWLPTKSQKEEMVKNHSRFATEANPILNLQVGPQKGADLTLGRRKARDQPQTEQDEDGQKLKLHSMMRSQNGYIHSPSLKKLAMNSVDGRSILKTEIASSNTRLMQIKHGVPMKQIIEEGQSKQYLGNQSLMDLDLMENSSVQFELPLPSTTEILIERPSMIRNSVDLGSVMKKTSTNKLKLQNINGRYSVRGSLSQPDSPSKLSLPQTTQFLPLPTLGNNTSTVLNPEGVILIPNYHQNKKAKVIKMADLVNIVNSGNGTASNGGSNLNSFREDGALRSKRGSSNDYHDGATRGNAQSALGIPSLQPSSMNLYQPGRKTALGAGFVKDPNQINYHKKLKDDFERYEKFLREQAQIEGYSMASSPGNKNSHIRQMIANSFLNVPYATSYSRFPTKKNSGLEIVSEHTSNKGEGDHFEYGNGSKLRQGQQHSGGPHCSFKHQSTKMLSSKRLNPSAIAQSVNLSSSKEKSSYGGETSFIDKQAQHHYELQGSTKLNLTGLQSLAQQKRSRLSRIERDQYLITAIINSIKGPTDQTRLEEAELLKKISDDFLWKECVTLLKDYYKLESLSVIRDNKQIMFGLYKLYLLHSLLVRIKQIEENPNHPALKKRGRREQQTNIQPLVQPNKNGDPLIYEEYSDDEHDAYHSDGGDEDEDSKKYRGYDKDDIYKHKMDSFIRLLQDILNPTEIPEASELDSVFQLKSSIRSYYQRKGELSDQLTETLYAMMQERPSILEAKQKYLFKPMAQTSVAADVTGGGSDAVSVNPSSNISKIHNLYYELEQMRLQSERDRIKSYREMLESLLTQANANQPSPSRRH